MEQIKSRTLQYKNAQECLDDHQEDPNKPKAPRKFPWLKDDPNCKKEPYNEHGGGVYGSGFIRMLCRTPRYCDEFDKPEELKAAIKNETLLYASAKDCYSHFEDEPEYLDEDEDKPVPVANTTAGPEKLDWQEGPWRQCERKPLNDSGFGFSEYNCGTHVFCEEFGNQAQLKAALKNKTLDYASAKACFDRCKLNPVYTTRQRLPDSLPWRKPKEGGKFCKMKLRDRFGVGFNEINCGTARYCEAFNHKSSVVAMYGEPKSSSFDKYEDRLLTKWQDTNHCLDHHDPDPK